MGIPFSVLDLSPILQGGTPAESFRNSKELAQLAENLGFNRYWVAEHHSMPGIASAATSVVLAHIAENTKKIRVGAGGIMLPNHSPLVIAEQFGTLESLYPGRIDLGVGRAPGSDQLTSRALRRNLTSQVDLFPNDVIELMEYFQPPRQHPKIHAIPGEGLKIPVWILGSSLYGAQLAAELGLPYAFASHFAPAQMMEALETYRRRFKPSEHLEKPYAMLGCNVIVADTDAHAKFLASSIQQSFINLRTGHPGQLPPPIENFEDNLDPQAQAILQSTLSRAAIGSKETVTEILQKFIGETKADELMITCHIFDHASRLRSYALTNQIRHELS
jgi:luciferase family oxidoreductase group 1